ncbi:MAG: molybdopterin-dependent oxidoreductase [Nocardioidaceae bacterium]
MRVTRGYGMVVGLVAAGFGLAVSELLSGLFHHRVSPVTAVAESVIALAPGSVAEWVIGLVGQHDKQLVIGMTLLGLVVISAAVGALSLRSVWAAEGLFVLMGVVLVLAVHARLSTSSSTYIPAVAGVLAAMIALTVLATRATATATRQGEGTTPQPVTDAEPALSRRGFVMTAGVFAGAAVVAGAGGRLLGRSRRAVEAARGQLTLPPGRGLHPPVRGVKPPGVEVGVDGVAPWVTPQRTFYRIDTALAVPEILPGDWQLRVHGMVDREVTLTYQDLLDRGLRDAWVTLCCVSNPVGGGLIGNAHWSGVRIADILAEAGIHPDADAVLSTSADGWTAATPLGALTDGRNSMLAVAMNGEPLTSEHGFPVRMVVPGLYGYVSATKWVVDLEVTRFDDVSGYWTERGWSPRGPVKTESRIDVPDNQQRLAAGKIAIAGVAWAQHTGITGVEVRVDEGQWMQARLAADPTTDCWRQWVYTWDATPGEHQLQVRATDESGYTQTGEVADVVPDGATGWDTISVDVVHGDT